MAPKIYFGINLNFAKYVYGRKRSLEVVRRQLGLRHAEMVADNEFGPVFYLRAPEAFRTHHWQVADHARIQGVSIPSVCTVYRDTGAIAHAHPEIRESAYHVGLAMLEQAACYRSSYVAAALFTMNREEAEDPERYQSSYFTSLEIWKRWMTDARRLGLKGVLVETSAAYREGCSTIEDTRATLGLLDEHHGSNPGTTVPAGICYDTGHGISAAESRDEANRDFRAWFASFPDRIHALHLKNTDPDFVETWHFPHEAGIIDPFEVMKAARDTLTVPELHVFLEVPGKRGRDVGEKRSLQEHLTSIRTAHEALSKLGYRHSAEDHGWTHP